MTYKIILSTWYNGPGVDSPAIPERPDLGRGPHAQEVMRHYGIEYAEPQPSPITDSWIFTGCRVHPAEPPKWMSVYDEATGEKVSARALPLPSPFRSDHHHPRWRT